MKIIFLFLIAFYSLLTIAQTTTRNLSKESKSGHIIGEISDSLGNPIIFANVTLHLQKDSSFIKGALVDETGKFEFDDLTFNTYFIKINHPTYIKFQSPYFVISSDNSDVKLQPITLKSTVKSLDEVSIIATRPFIEKKTDKIIINIENSIVSAGNSVLEVLERSPGVIINQENSINLKGKEGVVVMIDGKLSPLSGSDIITYLKNIPSSNIQSIEIISNPSAKYDAAGNAGIINIKFKKNKNDGLNGNLTVSYGQGFYYKPTIASNFNYRKKNWNIFGSQSYSQPIQFVSFDINRKFFDEAKNISSLFNQNSFIKQSMKNNNSRLGLDYYFNKNTVIGFLINYNWLKLIKDGSTKSLIYNPDYTLDFRNQNLILSDEKRVNNAGNFNFKHTFDSLGNEITSDLDFGRYYAKINQDIDNISLNPLGQEFFKEQLATNQLGEIFVKSIKLDFLHPISNSGTFEAGLKSSLVTSDNTVKFFNLNGAEKILDSTYSNNFIYSENVNAIYSNYSKVLAKWDLQAGLRIEHTKTKGIQIVTSENFSRNYLNFFPNIVLNRKFSKNNSLSLSLAKRIDRPSYGQLNPFRIFVDSYTYGVGNPTLKPVITYLYELTHVFKEKYISTLSYSNSKQTIADIFVQDDITKISYQTAINFRDFEQAYISIYIPFKIKNILNSNITSSAYWNKYSSPLNGSTLTKQFSSWDIHIINNITLGKGWSIELNGFYQSKMITGMFLVNNMGQISTGLKKDSKNKLSTFKLVISDIFYTNQVTATVKYQNIDSFITRTWDSRVVTISFSYRFGKKTIPKSRQRNTGIEDEKRRAN